jgi:hypothetical protein
MTSGRSLWGRSVTRWRAAFRSGTPGWAQKRPHACYVPSIETVATWLGHRWCGMTTGHHYLQDRTPGQITLTCLHCGRTSPGWRVG